MAPAVGGAATLWIGAILGTVVVGIGAVTLVRAHRTLWASLALHGLNNGVVTVVAALAVLG